MKKLKGFNIVTLYRGCRANIKEIQKTMILMLQKQLPVIFKKHSERWELKQRDNVF